MKVNVITRHGPANYGSLLQTIATQNIVTRLGYDCNIIDYVPKCETGFHVAFTQLAGKKEWNKNILKKIVYLLAREPESLLMYRRFSLMRKKYLKMGPHCSSLEELHRIYGNDKDSVFVTGSDQVWGPISTGKCDPAYFLDFAPTEAYRCAFAASFGKTSFDSKTMEAYESYLKNYDYIAVRENTAVKMLKKIGVEAEQVLDPTLLMASDEWNNYIAPLRKPDKYVLVYQIHNNPELDRYSARFANIVGLPLIRVSPLLHQIRRSGKLVYCPDIGGFLDLIKSATYIVTDSFHGTAFAINFNTQFVEILPNTGTSSRNQNILLMTGLEDRIVHDLNDFRYVDTMIDFTMSNRIISDMRKSSIATLKMILDKRL